MNLMTALDQSRLRKRFEDELSEDVGIRLRIHAGPCDLCKIARRLIDEIASLSAHLATTLTIGDGTVPEIQLVGKARGRVGFIGLPSGYELPAFIDSILDVGRGTTSLAAASRKRLSRLRKPVRIQVFTTPT